MNVMKQPHTPTTKTHKSLTLTFGTDPELFCMSNDTGEVVSAITLFPGHDKNNPIDLGDGIKMYPDNVLLETSMPYGNTPQEITTIMRTAFKRMQMKLGIAHAIFPVASRHVAGLPPKPDDELVKKWLEDKSGDIQIPPEWQVGCNPNFDAWTGAIRPQTPFADALRTGSFHLHIGNKNYEDPEDDRLMTHESKIQAVKMLDIYVGLFGVMVSCDDSSAARRKLYGKAGEYRPTKYGIEYRVLDNFCLRSPKLVELVFKLAKVAMQSIEDGSAEHEFDNTDMGLVQQAINEQNKTLAEKLFGQTWIASATYKEAEDAAKVKYSAFNMLEKWGI